jgi:hypothetical protein
LQFLAIFRCFRYNSTPAYAISAVVGGPELRLRCTILMGMLCLCAVARAATRGDVNGDGLADGLDVGAMTALLTGSGGDATAAARADLNCDGILNDVDGGILLRVLVEGFPPAEAGPVGDVNGDSTRDGRDVALLAQVLTGADSDPARTGFSIRETCPRSFAR